mgnify:FL=1|jgi:membrane associated rhomboid family serine protease
MAEPLILLLLLNILLSFKGFRDPLFFERYKFSVLKIRKNETFRLFSSGFLHVDTTHLIFNMFTLYIFGDVAIQLMGAVSFYIVYGLSLFSGNYFTYLNHKNEPNYTAVGASGAVSGIVYSSILLFPKMKLAFLFLPIPIPGYIFGILYLLYTLFGMKSRHDNIGHTAHFGGAVSGFATTLFIYPSLLYTETYLILLMLIPIIGYVVMKQKGKL